MSPGVPLAFGGRRLHAGLNLGIRRLDAVLLRELDPAERVLALDDAERAVAALLLDQVVERARLAHVLRDVRRKRGRHLAALRKPERELRLLDRGDDALRFRHELRLAQPTRRL